MTQLIPPLWAEQVVRTTFEWGRIQSNADWIAPVAVCIAVLLFVRFMYLRDAVELRPFWRWLLTALRTAAFLGLLVLYLQPHWRTEREEVRNSRAVVLVDASLSMGQADSAANENQEQENSRGPTARGAAAFSPTRSQQVAAALAESDFLDQLRKTHDVVVVPFGKDIQRDRITTLKKTTPKSENADGSAAIDGKVKTEPPPDWQKLLAPTGLETRLGQTLRQTVQENQGGTLSAVIVFSDGGQNAGISPEAAVELAREANIPIHAVGLGSDRQPANAAVCDLAVPARAYPGDRYTVTGFLQAHGLAGRSATVEVLSRPAGRATDQAPGEVVESQQVTLGGDGEVLPVKFELTPKATGRFTLGVRVLAPPGDRNPADNLREADIEIVDRKNRVLLIADGPMREYQFLRNQLFRDRYTTVDVWLQSGREGMSQDANKILDDFPSTREEMFDYDCIAAFDPNWKLLKPEQVELLEKWVGEQGGGLIVAAGPVDACRGAGGWVQDPNLTTIRNLYPVEFFGRMASTDFNMVSSREPCPLDFSREGQEADFLGLADSATASRTAWASFPGVYSYCPLRGPKPGATVYARVSDPQISQNGEGTVYFAGQFYGAGTVFYMGSAEMWRLRAIDETYFAQLYTKLIRHVSQGRLLRGSSRGVLLVGQDRYLLGNTVELRAQLTDMRLEPLAAPGVNVQIVQPDGASRTLVLKPDPARAGAYVGQFPALLEGTYHIELPVPESENERLSRRIQVKVPDLERENLTRNDAVLSAIAKNTGGKYYVGVSSAIAPRGTPPLVGELKDRTSTVILPVAPNPQQEEDWLRTMMIVLCGLLCLEWLIRRLLKLA